MTKKYSQHAEELCIAKVKDKHILKQATLILIRLDNKGDLIACRPCTKCQSMINKYKIKRVICHSASS